MRYRLVIFDFDGTLADSFAWFVDIFNDVADRYRFRRIGEGELESLRGLSGRQMMRHVGASRWRLPFIARYVRSQRSGYTGQVSLFPGVGEMLRGLADAGVTLAIVSSNSEANVRDVLGADNARLIRHYECGAAIFGKRASFRKVLRRSGVAPGATLCVGDEIRDLEAARSLGLAFGAVAWGYTLPEALRALDPEEEFERVERITGTLARRDSGATTGPA